VAGAKGGGGGLSRPGGESGTRGEKRGKMRTLNENNLISALNKF
jgi:hypothetical protein